MLGLHIGHNPVRGNVGWDRGDMPLRTSDTTFVQLMDQAGYVTGMFGKWSLGLKGTSGAPSRKGFDAFFGYEDQSEAHSYFMNTLQEIDQGVTVNVDVDTTQYTHDLFIDASLDFIERHQNSPFFLYLPLTIPHAALEVPKESLQPYLDNAGKSIFPEPNHSETEIYAETDKPLATYAAMVSRLDKGIALIRKKLEHLGIADNTIVFFTSDNGPHSEGGYDPTYFDSNGPFRGQKRDLYEGGIRVPMIAWWPGRIKANITSDHISAFWDFLPTACELANVEVPSDIDGISFMPTLLGNSQPQHEFLYWEFHERGGKQAIVKDEWKAVRLNVGKDPNGSLELYNLENDPFEQQNVAERYPELVESFARMMEEEREPSSRFNFGRKPN